MREDFDGYVTKVEGVFFADLSDRPERAQVTIGDDLKFSTFNPASWPVGSKVHVTVETLSGGTDGE